MRECPKCNYVDPPYWRNRLFDYEVDICKLEDLEHIDIDLMLELVATKRATKDNYVYKLTKTNWVYRIWKPLFDVRGWSPQKYYDGTGSRASTLRKINLQAYNSTANFERMSKWVKDSHKSKEIAELRAAITKELEAIANTKS